MRSIVISGYYGFGNAGDEAMLAAIIEAFIKIDSNIQIIVISGNTADTTKRHGVKAIYRLNYLAIFRELLFCNLLISGGGSLIQDVTSGRSLYYYLSIIFIAKQLNKPVMLYAQGIGPVHKKIARQIMKWVCNKIDLITVRDKGSFYELHNFGVSVPKIIVTADPVLALTPVDIQIGLNIFHRHKISTKKPIIGIAAREWKEWIHYKQILAETADAMIKNGSEVVFLPMQSPDDIIVANKIIKRMKQKPLSLSGTYSTKELMSMVGNCDILIGIRLHALIFAAIMKVPVLGISYDPKIDRFIEMLGYSNIYTLREITTKKLINKINFILDHPEKITKKINTNIIKLRKKAFLNAYAAFKLINYL